MPEELSWTALPTVSVIIPTYNRKDSLLRTLDSLSRQTYPAERFEVIVVDDGGSDGTEVLVQHIYYPFALRYVRQLNQGATVARNCGAEQSRGQVFVFIDDDIELSASVLQHLIAELISRERTIILGALRAPSETSRFVSRLQYFEEEGQGVIGQNAGEYVPFQECMTGLLAVSRQDFQDLGMFQDPSGGWPNWDDVDFGYRANQASYRFWRSRAAVAMHWDYAATDLHASASRWYRASVAVSGLFQKHPDLRGQIPMFREKEPIAWHQDAPELILNKLARRVIWSQPVMWVMERAVPYLERYAPQSKLLILFYRWIVSGYIYRGYRDGLREIAQRANL